MNAFEIGRSGLNVHGKRIEIAAKNVAKDSPIDKPVISSLWVIDFSTANTHTATTQRKKYKLATTFA